jgi:hypothetical protein
MTPIATNAEDGQEAAKLCALMLVAQMKAALGTLGRVARTINAGCQCNAVSAFHPPTAA